MAYALTALPTCPGGRAEPLHRAWQARCPFMLNGLRIKAGSKPAPTIPTQGGADIHAGQLNYAAVAERLD